jgi:peptidoglycan hydrolase-like protein with peptidoglycan-binding domain
MTPPTPHRRVHAHRARRSTVFLASALVVVGLPLVAQAIDSDAAELSGTTAVSPTTGSDGSDRPARRLQAIVPELGAGIDAPSVPSARSAATPPPSPAPAPTPEELALETAILVVTDTYQWDERSPRVEALQRTLGVVVDGWYGHSTYGAHRAALEAAGFPIDALPVPVVPPGPSAEQWAALRRCESGGDYSITNPSGKYRGAYQFDRRTWDSVAGRHLPHLVGRDPAGVSPAEQDAMAYALYSERGHRPWPQCGRHLR